MSDMSRIGRCELESELHKWRTGHQLGAMQEDLNAMQARAIEAESAIARVRALVSTWRQCADRTVVHERWRVFRECADELESVLEGTSCE